MPTSARLRGAPSHLPTVPGGPGRDLRDPVATGRTGRVRLRRTARGGPTPVPDTLLLRLLQAAGRERARRRWLTTGLGLLAAACAIALIVIVVPSSSGPKPAPRAMAALVATPVHATIALQPRSWGTEIDLTCWYQRGAAEPSSDRYELVAHGADGATYDLGSWRLAPGQRVIFTSGTALTETQIKNLQITQPNGPAILAFGVPRLFRTADR